MEKGVHLNQSLTKKSVNLHVSDITMVTGRSVQHLKNRHTGVSTNVMWTEDGLASTQATVDSHEDNGLGPLGGAGRVLVNPEHKAGCEEHLQGPAATHRLTNGFSCSLS